MISNIITKCLSNIIEITKAFNVMVTLHDTSQKIFGIIERNTRKLDDDEFLDEDLLKQFSKIIMTTNKFATSKKLQFLTESSRFPIENSNN